MARHSLAIRAGLVAAIAALGPGAGLAEAGAWTRDKGELLFISGLSFHQLLPAEGYDGQNRIKSEASVYAEYGLSERFTLIGRAAWQSMQITELQSEEIGFSVKVKPPYDPLRDDPDEDFDGDGLPNRVDPPAPLPARFERRTKTRYFTAEPETGLGGIEAGLRVQILQRGRWALSAQAAAGIPGTGENRNNDRFGEGGGSVELRVQAGRSFGRSTFVNASLGVRSLPNSRRDEMRLDLTAGTHVMRGVRVMAQTYSVWSLGDVPIRNYSYSGHRAQLSVLWPIDDRRRAQLSALTTLSRTNMSRETAIMASVWRTF